MNLRFILLFIYPFFTPFFQSNLADLGEDPALSYIKKYGYLAKGEMKSSGIPASIKMAQALIESENGKSELASNSNNHFGIKCGKNWEGNTYFKVDDDLDENGQLIQSCFRAFTTVEESYRAHTDFLTDPKKEKRYGFLFLLPADDYKSWAYGLKDAGYASDPNYPNKLIRVIEKYDLQSLDKGIEITKVIKTKTQSDIAVVNKESSKLKKDVLNNNTLAILKFKEKEINNTKSIVLQDKSTLDKIANHFKKDIGDLISNNDFIFTSSMIIPANTYIFLEKKDKTYHGEQKTHKVIKGETVEKISNIYGIRAKTLYSLNRMHKGTQPIEGSILELKNKVLKANAPKTFEEKSKKYLFD
jgi:hypothetical protein